MPLCARGFIVSDAQRETGGTGVGDPKEAAKILGVRIHMNSPKNGQLIVAEFPLTTMTTSE